VLSETRSRDDITICGFIDISKATSFIQTLKLTNKRIDLQSELADIESRLKSMDSMGKMAALKESFEKACSEVVQIENTIEELKKDHEAVLFQIDRIDSYSDQSLRERLRRRTPQLWEQVVELPEQIISVSNTLQKALDDRAKKEQEYLAYQNKKEGLLKEREEILRQISSLASDSLVMSENSQFDLTGSESEKMADIDEPLETPIEIKVDAIDVSVVDKGVMPMEYYNKNIPLTTTEDSESILAEETEQQELNNADNPSNICEETVCEIASISCASTESEKIEASQPNSGNRNPFQGVVNFFAGNGKSKKEKP